MKTKYLYINTIGCQMNVYDSERIAALMTPLGYRLTDSVRAADLVVVNTCTIREKAEQKAFSFLGRLADLKRKKPSLIIAVGGCVAQQEGRQIFKRVPFADVVFGTHAVGRLPRMVERVESRRCRVTDVEMTAEIDEFELPDGFAGNGEVSRFVTIMQGCDNFCTYCVVPYVRGREASRRPERIVAEIRSLVRNGVREVTLLGQNVNSYGKKEGLCSFAELLEQVNAIDGLYRIRFTTSHPKDLSPELTRTFGELEKLCHHIHLPVQSGSDRVLKRMNRKYTRAHYLDRLDRLRQVCPDIAVTSDMIVGFPGESRRDFEETLDLIRTVEYDGLFAFKYSDRPLAPASKFSDKVPEPEQNDRLQTLLALQEAYTLRKNRALIGTRPRVLVDGLSRRSDAGMAGEVRQWRGRTDGNKIVNFVWPEGVPEQDWMGHQIRVEIEEAFTHSLRGRPVTDKPSSLKGEESYAA
ncbi:tRNA (N6-isopentenyl adenosine(37)-C2)-methylthi otransferase MiaB [Desulfonema ishimotonii]|uniref:tRNA-2-methylthio-N(6)-dimethylallyladenosine synthase n=1 Tax=Desulfonema ishimotonii TaxID=45657 RepID=A0A401FXI5_9BACT|nr:tRNA (N6-isopentenyl adenosine(37)-C2)-methylthiotransferase MiaB [Desulfonema ishimotonii]GBC61698.1 tRNA (N6-isopentenyl adenosine(37)-C2)-methylthi otransferase MiaB [Desulfonema ishimotonii]